MFLLPDAGYSDKTLWDSPATAHLCNLLPPFFQLVHGYTNTTANESALFVWTARIGTSLQLFLLGPSTAPHRVSACIQHSGRRTTAVRWRRFSHTFARSFIAIQSDSINGPFVFQFILYFSPWPKLFCNQRPKMMNSRWRDYFLPISRLRDRLPIFVILAPVFLSWKKERSIAVPDY